MCAFSRGFDAAELGGSESSERHGSPGPGMGRPCCRDNADTWRGDSPDPVSRVHAGPVRPAPARITRLDDDEIFVFGANEQGRHHGGAARFALDHFGAILGQGSGLQGRSYALNSMSGLTVLAEETRAFLGFARSHPLLTFLVTEVGCGIAGHTPSEVAPLFASGPPNVRLPQSFLDVLRYCPRPGAVVSPGASDGPNQPGNEPELNALVDALDASPGDTWRYPPADDVRRLAALDDIRLLEEIARFVLLRHHDVALVSAGFELLAFALYVQGRTIEAGEVLDEASATLQDWIDLGAPAHRIQLAWMIRSDLALQGRDVGLGQGPEASYDLLNQAARIGLVQQAGWDRGFLLMTLCKLSEFDAPELRSAHASTLPRAVWARLALRLLAGSPHWAPGSWFSEGTLVGLLAQAHWSGADGA